MTEQQLRERAEALLDRNTSHYFKFLHPDTRNKMIDFALDFHKQELQRIGEVYQAVSVEDELPNEDEIVLVFTNPSGEKELAYRIGNSWYEQEKGLFTQNIVAHWLKKLSLSNVGEKDVTGDNKNSIDNCDAPFDSSNSIQNLTKESLEALGFKFESIGHNDFELLGTFTDENGIEVNWYNDNTFGVPYGIEGNVMELNNLTDLVYLRMLLTNKKEAGFLDHLTNDEVNNALLNSDKNAQVSDTTEAQ